MATTAKIKDRIDKLEAKALSTAFAPEAAALRAKAAELRAAVAADPAASNRTPRRTRAAAPSAGARKSTVRGVYPYSVLFSSSAGG